jgi:hypothetical protein
VVRYDKQGDPEVAAIPLGNATLDTAICWGQNAVPHDLRSAVNTYFAAPCSSGYLKHTPVINNDPKIWLALLDVKSKEEFIEKLIEQGARTPTLVVTRYWLAIKVLKLEEIEPDIFEKIVGTAKPKHKRLLEDAQSFYDAYIKHCKKDPFFHFGKWKPDYYWDAFYLPPEVQGSATLSIDGLYYQKKLFDESTLNAGVNGTDFIGIPNKVAGIFISNDPQDMGVAKDSYMVGRMKKVTYDKKTSLGPAKVVIGIVPEMSETGKHPIMLMPDRRIITITNEEIKEARATRRRGDGYNAHITFDAW